MQVNGFLQEGALQMGNLCFTSWLYLIKPTYSTLYKWK